MDINKVLVYNIKGKTAHFKKYYSNKSSLTYKVPSRTVLMGMVASILKYSRDSYYDIFSTEKAKFGIKIEKPGSTHFECMNYLKEGGGHTQVRLQLLLPKEDKLEYKVYFTHENNKIMSKLENKIKNNKLGYGLFFGQRQFRADLDFKYVINDLNIKRNYRGEVSTLTYKNNIKDFEIDNEIELTVDNMPISFKKSKKGREPQSIKEVCYEENGDTIKGNFKEILKTNRENISFFTPIGRN